VWRDIAQNGNGRFIPIPQDGGQVVIIETPYDEDIIILQREINGTVIPYGPRAMQKRTEDKTQQLSKVAAAAPSQASEMASYLNKRSKYTSEAVTGDGDLVADVSAGRSSFSAIRDEDLPDNLRAMKPEQRIDEVNKQMTQRKELNAKLSTLVAKRDKCRRRTRQGAAKGVVIRPRGRGYAEGADQAVGSIVAPANAGAHNH
jgi:flagellar biosynthesis chaperone FliJ